MVDLVNPAQAANIYQTMQGLQKAVPAARENDAPSFGDMVKGAATSSIDSLRAGEKASAQAVTGQADLTEVVEAVTAADLTLQTVVAVRDRMLSAYQEIMRMPI